ncbi:MAG: choline dehydrogenase [Gammaproteobacteria bacterium]|jgi:choline dehydrogenase
MNKPFDYIIVGAGSAGCVLANRLSEDKDVRVLLLEAGGVDNNIYIHVPAGMMDVMNARDIQWLYRSEPESQLGGREMWQQRGKVLGGSSSINAMMYMRGNPGDYDNWEAMGAKGWSYADVLPYFKKSESFDGDASDYRGTHGPLGVHRNKLNNLLFGIFIEAGIEAGYPRSSDLNGCQQEGFGPADSTVRNGRRSSTARDFLRPASNRSNMEVRVNSLVTKVLIESGRATGVVVKRNGQSETILANREVILCGGAINSPQLLMLSGIGPQEHLREHGIELNCNLPGVGANLMDHLCVYMQWECKEPVSVQPYARIPGRWLAGLRWLLFKDGVAASTQGEACGFIRSRAGVEWPDIQIDFMPACILEDLSVAPIAHGFSAHVGPLRPLSRGRIELSSAVAEDAPKIFFNYLDSEEDWRDMRASVRLTREIHRQPAFDQYRGRELLPGDHVVTDADIDAFIRDTATTNFHISGTCKMGTDESAVCDPRCRVYGVEGLRVVDASVMPQLVSGNTNGPTIMIAEKVADDIRGNKEPALRLDVQVADEWQNVQRLRNPTRPDPA